jgi:hypothetical protein
VFPIAGAGLGPSRQEGGGSAEGFQRGDDFDFSFLRTGSNGCKQRKEVS